MTVDDDDIDPDDGVLAERVVRLTERSAIEQVWVDGGSVVSRSR